MKHARVYSPRHSGDAFVCSRRTGRSFPLPDMIISFGEIRPQVPIGLNDHRVAYLAQKVDKESEEPRGWFIYVVAVDTGKQTYESRTTPACQEGTGSTEPQVNCNPGGTDDVGRIRVSRAGMPVWSLCNAFVEGKCTQDDDVFEPAILRGKRPTQGEREPVVLNHGFGVRPLSLRLDEDKTSAEWRAGTELRTAKLPRPDPSAE